MPKIDCNVTNCSHNTEGICYANRVNIGGESAECKSETCCGSFLNKLNYSDLTNNTFSSGACDCLVCNVDSCKYNSNSLCDLEGIQVDGEGAMSIYTDTCCRSFKGK